LRLLSAGLAEVGVARRLTRAGAASLAALGPSQVHVHGATVTVELPRAPFSGRDSRIAGLGRPLHQPQGPTCFRFTLARCAMFPVRTCDLETYAREIAGRSLTLNPLRAALQAEKGPRARPRPSRSPKRAARASRRSTGPTARSRKRQAA